MIASPRDNWMIDAAQPVDWACPLNRGLVAWWLGIPGWTGGRRLIDITSPGPNGNHGVLIDIEPATDWVPGLRGIVALNYGGTGTVSRAGGTYTVVGGDLTLSVHFNHFTGSISRGVYHHGHTGTTAGNWQVALNNADVWFVDWPNGGSLATHTLTYSSDLTSNAEPWHNLVITRVAMTGAIIGYIDGVEFDSTTGQIGLLDSAQATKPLIIGRARLASGLFVGLMDDIRIWNRALLPSEVQSVYFDSLQRYPQTLRRLRPAVFPAAVVTGRILVHPGMSGGMKLMTGGIRG